MQSDFLTKQRPVKLQIDLELQEFRCEVRATAKIAGNNHPIIASRKPPAAPVGLAVRLRRPGRITPGPQGIGRVAAGGVAGVGSLRPGRKTNCRH
jgi:hypothetical protein